MKNRFFSIKVSDGTVKNFTIFADGYVSVQYFKTGEKVRTKYLGKYNNWIIGCTIGTTGRKWGRIWKIWTK